MTTGVRRPFGIRPGYPGTIWVVALWLVGGTVRAEEFPGLTRWPGQEPASLEAYNGQVVVLDFFAHWCGPCLAASRELQVGIQDYYQRRGTNAHGFRVRVVPINIDQTAPARTRRFVERAGLREVLDDQGGGVFEAYGGTGLPYIVVLDLTRPGPASPAKTAGSFTGHPGLEPLRRLIDSLGGKTVAGARAGGDTGESLWQILFGPRPTRAVEASGEGLMNSDFRLYDTSLSWRETRPAWDYLLQGNWSAYDLDYEPAPSDMIGRPADLWEEKTAFQGRLRGRWHPEWQAEAGGGYYDGFADYRSVWLDEYYRQYFAPLPGYKEADPRGYNFSSGLRWEYLPATGFVQANLIYQRDHVAPSYEKILFEPLLRGTEKLHTWAGSLSLENVVSPHLRALQEFQATDTTDRDMRYQYTLLLNWAPVDAWVVRGTGGATLEPPEFHAYYGQVSLEHDWRARWFAGCFGRYYTDDGLVRDPKIVSSAAPSLHTVRTGLFLRYQGESVSAKVAAGPYYSRYDPVPPISQHFSTLYEDRDWFFFEAAVNLRF